jgi:hypothetical protein
MIESLLRLPEPITALALWKFYVQQSGFNRALRNHDKNHEKVMEHEKFQVEKCSCEGIVERRTFYNFQESDAHRCPLGFD